MILAAVLLKMGGYGLIRFNLRLFPEASAALAPLMIALAVIGILYGAVVAFAQSDAKKLVAYSSVSHMGYIVLGIFRSTRSAFSGAILQMVNHGLSTGGLFLIIGFIYERRHTREMAKFGGIWCEDAAVWHIGIAIRAQLGRLARAERLRRRVRYFAGRLSGQPVWTAFATFGMVLQRGLSAHHVPENLPGREPRRRQQQPEGFELARSRRPLCHCWWCALRSAS